MSRILLKNGKLWQELLGEFVVRDVLIEGNTIMNIEESIEPVSSESLQVYDLNQKLVTPGFVDPHVHFRSPGLEYKETIETGSRSAAKGGFTAVVCMPNTKPPLDTPEWIRWVEEQGREAKLCRVYAYGAITKGQRGQELTDFAGLKQAGAVGFTDDGVGVQHASMMQRAMTEAASLGLPIVTHSEDETLSGKGCMNAGDVSRRLGLEGIPGMAESVQVARDLILAKETGAHLHVCHISDEMSVEAVRWGKSLGIRVTAEVTPHHLLLTDECITGEDSNYKVNPPVRAEKDRQACIRGLLDGTIDMIATDHAPHSVEEKKRAFAVAPFGFVGLELAFPLLYTHLVRTGVLPLERLLHLMSSAPASVFQLPVGELKSGGLADLTVIDLEQRRPVDPETFATLGRNTPFVGWELYGWTVLTILNGQVTFEQISR